MTYDFFLHTTDLPSNVKVISSAEILETSWVIVLSLSPSLKVQMNFFASHLYVPSMVASLSSFFIVTLSLPSLENSATAPTGGPPSSDLVTTHVPTSSLGRSSSARAFAPRRHTAI